MQIETPRHSTRVRHGTVLALVAGAGWLPAATAAQWSIEPRVGWTLSYNSNLLLSTSGELATGGTTLSLDSPFKRTTETTEIDLIPHVDAQRFFSDHDLDAVNGSVQGVLAAHSERSSFKLTGAYEHTSTLITELTDTGIIDTNSRREASTVELDLGRDLTERQRLDLDGFYTNVVYPGGETSGLVGYRYPGATLTDTVQISTRISVGVSLYTDRLHAPLTGYDARDTGVRLNYSQQFSQRTKLTASGSYSETTTNGFVQHGYYWDLHSTRVSERTQWDLELSSTLQPSGSGLLLRRDTAVLSALHSISERLDLTLSAQGVRNNNLSGGHFAGVGQYLSADAGFNWHCTQQIVAGWSAGFAQSRSVVADAQTAHGWHTGLTLTWSPVPRSMSR